MLSNLAAPASQNTPVNPKRQRSQPAPFVRESAKHYVVQIPPRAGGPVSKAFAKRQGSEKALLNALLFRDLIFLSEEQPLQHVARRQRRNRTSALPAGISISIARVTKARPKPEIGYFRAYWNDGGIQISRYFSVAKFGSPKAALHAAIATRNLEVAAIQRKQAAQDLGLSNKHYRPKSKA